VRDAKGSLNPDPTESRTSDQESSEYDDDFDNDVMSSGDQDSSSIEIEGNDIAATWKGMTESVRLHFVTKLIEYVSINLKKHKGQDLQLFEVE